jgi:hypothetical protein
MSSMSPDLHAIALRAKALYAALGASDPVIWARRKGWHPDPVQATILRNKSKRVLLCCSRQFGKSTTAAAVAGHAAVTRPGSMILLVSPSQRQSIELFSKVKVYTRGEKKLKDGAFEQHLANNSRIVAVPGTEETIRSFSSVDLLIEDEAARVPDDLYKSIRPMLAVSRGRLFLLTTPFGQRGHFYDEWVGGRNWSRFEVRAEDCPRIDADFLADERDALGESWFEQEYRCKFLATDDTLFSPEEIQRVFSRELEALPTYQDAVKPLFGAP